MTVVRTQLIENRTQMAVDAQLHLDLSFEQVVRVEQVWGPVRLEGFMRLLSGGTGPDQLPQHWHWNWVNKLQDVDRNMCRFVGIECDNAMQGLMRVTRQGHVARLPPDEGKVLVYVEFLESAPWNTRVFTPSPRYKGAGLRLIEAAARWSLEEGLEGRIGLHALPQATDFYVRACGMTLVGQDESYDNLPYLELTRDGAATLLKGGERP
jgi:hypothetical protein